MLPPVDTSIGEMTATAGVAAYFGIWVRIMKQRVRIVVVAVVKVIILQNTHYYYFYYYHPYLALHNPNPNPKVWVEDGAKPSAYRTGELEYILLHLPPQFSHLVTIPL